MAVFVEGGCGGSDDHVGELEEQDGCYYGVEEDSLDLELEVGLRALVDCY